MKVLFVTLVTSSEKSGIYYYITKLVDAITKIKIDKSFTFYVLTNDELIGEFSFNEHVKIIKINMPHHPRWFMRPIFFVWLNTFLKVIVNKYDIDLIHFPNPVPLVFKNKKKVIVTIHDVAEYRNTRFNYFHRWFRRMVTKSSVIKSDSIITVSEFSKNEIIKCFNAFRLKVYVTYLASRFEVDYGNTNKKYEKYILHLGGMHINKNIKRILEAYSKLQHDIKLYFVGNTINLKSIGNEYTSINNIKFLGFLSDEELKKKLKCAKLLLYPSIYEGFGLPILEAMSQGVPVITSNCSSMPEVAGNAALLVNPNSTQEILEAINSLLVDEYTRDTLIKRGFERCNMFDWKITAMRTIEVYYKTIEENR